MNKQLAAQLRKVTVPEIAGPNDKQRIVDALFTALNRKLNPIGLNIFGARLGFRPAIVPSEIFAKLRAANLV